MLGEVNLLYDQERFAGVTLEGDRVRGSARASGDTAGISLAFGGTAGPTTIGVRTDLALGVGREVMRVGGRRAALDERDGLFSLGLDLFLRWHFPHHLAVTVGAGLGATIVSTDAVTRVTDEDEDSNIVPGAGPFRLQASVMKLFWVSDQWSTGVRSRVLVSGPSGYAVAIGLAWVWVYQ